VEFTTGAGSSGLQVSLVALMFLKPEVVLRTDVTVERVVVTGTVMVVVLVMPGMIE